MGAAEWSSLCSVLDFRVSLSSLASDHFSFQTVFVLLLCFSFSLSTVTLRQGWRLLLCFPWLFPPLSPSTHTRALPKDCFCPWTCSRACSRCRRSGGAGVTMMREGVGVRFLLWFRPTSSRSFLEQNRTLVKTCGSPPPRKPLSRSSPAPLPLLVGHKRQPQQEGKSPDQ